MEKGSTFDLGPSVKDICTCPDRTVDTCPFRYLLRECPPKPLVDGLPLTGTCLPIGFTWMQVSKEAFVRKVEGT